MYVPYIKLYSFQTVCGFFIIPQIIVYIIGFDSAMPKYCIVKTSKKNQCSGLKVSDQLVAYATRFFILRLKNFM